MWGEIRIFGRQMTPIWDVGRWETSVVRASAEDRAQQKSPQRQSTHGLESEDDGTRTRNHRIDSSVVAAARFRPKTLGSKVILSLRGPLRRGW